MKATHFSVFIRTATGLSVQHVAVPNTPISKVYAPQPARKIRVARKQPKTVRITAKCADLFGATLHDEKGKQLGEYSGYVPSWMPGEHFGNYVELDIDLATGKILNWQAPTALAIGKTFGVA